MLDVPHELVEHVSWLINRFTTGLKPGALRLVPVAGAASAGRWATGGRALLWIPVAEAVAAAGTPAQGKAGLGQGMVADGQALAVRRGLCRWDGGRCAAGTSMSKPRWPVSHVSGCSGAASPGPLAAGGCLGVVMDDRCRYPRRSGESLVGEICVVAPTHQDPGLRSTSKTGSAGRQLLWEGVQFPADPGWGLLTVEPGPLVVAAEPVLAGGGPWMTVVFIRVAARRPRVRGD